MAKTFGRPTGPDTELFRKAAQLSSVAYSIGIPPIIGYAVDRWLDSLPVCLIIGTILGFMTGMLQLFRFAGIIGDSSQRKPNQSAEPSPKKTESDQP